MTEKNNQGASGGTRPPKSTIFNILKPYKGMISVLLLLALLGNSVNLVIPKIISHGIDSYTHGNFSYGRVMLLFFAASFFILLFTFLQSVVQTYASERVARDMRSRLSEKISRQSYRFIQQANPSKLLTNLTSDADSVKMFVSMAIVSIASSLFIIIGAGALLISIDWKLALCVLAVLP